MPQYAVLVNWTEEGIRTVKKVPQRAEQFRTAVESSGGRVVAFLHTMGAFDAVAAVELPSDEVANEVLLRLGSQGFARTVTLKGWTTAEFAKLAEKL
ncbi:MAG TPA: GYD domain-containing protein [Thermoplasmata archaeon]|nr:GYD domain-containing protein [Thermoplasmata archaeon]